MSAGQPFRLPPLVVEYNQLWVQADVSGKGDSRSWAQRAAAELLSRPQWAACQTPGGEKQLTALMERAAGIARKQQGASMGFILIPSPEEGVKGMAAFCPVDIAGRNAGEAWEDLLAELAPPLPGDYPPEVTPMETKAGECRRLRLRYASGEGPERPVGEHVGYLWVFEDYGAAIMMTMSFASLLEAARWLPALDQLASDAWLQRDPGKGEPS
ncbi:MAG TPA: hypothetical protein VE733_13680 [Streptosporangiaceae bacterium]|jgi:hypothetical protein|nr:hypothetical protein [Streptosporangiaceae bacterium]